jgi:hypothetical protein
MDSIEQKKVHNVHVKRVVQKLAHSVKAFCVTRIFEQVMANRETDSCSQGQLLASPDEGEGEGLIQFK